MNAPFFHSAIGLVGGLIVSSPLSSLSMRVASGIFAAAYLVFLFREGKRGRSGWLCCAALVAGVLLPHVALPWRPVFQPLSSGQSSVRADVTGRVDGPIDRGLQNDRIFLRLERIERHGEPLPIAGRARLTLYWKHADIRYGDKVRIRRVRLHRPKGFSNPGSFDYETYMTARGISAVGGVSRPSQIQILDRKTSPSLLGSLYTFRERLLSAVYRHLPKGEAQALNAMLFGERRLVPRRIQSAFYDSGVGHLLAISGLHVGFVALFLYRLLFFVGRWTPRSVSLRMPPFLMPSRFAAFGAVPLVLAYMIIAGARVTTVRASIMVVTYLVARFLQRDRDHFNTLGLAALIILLWDGRFLFDAGFQLSFVAVLVILAGLRAFPDKSKIREFIRVTILVSLSMIPILAFHFHRVSLYGVAANLALIPLASILVPAGLMVSVFGAVFTGWAELLFYPVHLLTYLLLEGAQRFSDLPHAALRVLPPTPIMLLTLYTVVAAGFFLNRSKVLRNVAVGASLAVFGASILWTGLFQPRLAKGGELGIVFLDVGNDDATFVRLPDGRTLLVDAAGKYSESFDVGEAVVVPYLEKQWVRRIDYALLTNPGRNQAGGFPAVLRLMPVGELWESGIRSRKPLRGQILEAAKARNVPIHPLRRGKTIPGRGYQIEVLHPTRWRKSGGRRNDNNQSIVVRLVHGKVRILLASNLERRGERDLIRSGENLRADVLRVPHYGSASSSSSLFLERVRPRAAVISASRPWRGQPSRKILTRYKNLGAEIFRTDKDGAVRLWSNGQSYRLESTLKPVHRFQAKVDDLTPVQMAADQLGDY
jgi:competence protein ComEC